MNIRSLLLALALVALTACQFNQDRPLNQQEVNQLIRENSLPGTIGVETVGDAITVVLIDDPAERGCVLSGQGDSSGFFSRRTTAHPSIGPGKDGVFTSADWQRFYTVVCVIITDPQLRQTASSLAVEFENGKVVTVPADGRPGYVISQPSPASEYSDTFRSLTIDDGDPATPPRVATP